MSDNKKTVWVVVADEAIVRILQRVPKGEGLEPVEEMTDADAHAATAELRRDAYGRRAGAAPQGSGGNNAYRLRGGSGTTSSASDDEQHQHAEQFARRVAQRLDEARREGRFDELRIAAAPRFLGLLRKAISPQVAAMVTQELDKDFVHLTAPDLSERLFPQPTGGR